MEEKVFCCNCKYYNWVGIEEFGNYECTHNSNIRYVDEAICRSKEYLNSPARINWNNKCSNYKPSVFTKIKQFLKLGV